MKKIEKIQKQALRYVFNDYTSNYDELLKKASKTMLYVQRIKSILSIVQKCLQKACPSYLNDMFRINQGSNSRMFLPLVQHKVNTTKYGINSVCYQGSQWWNRVDNKYKLSGSFNEWQPKCNCRSCDLCILMEV